MAGLSLAERESIDKKHLADVCRYLGQFKWQRVMVLTIARGSRSAFVNKSYPAFRDLLAHWVGPTLEDFWNTEKGDVGDRLHINALLTAEPRLPEELVDRAWTQTVGSRIWNYDYKPEFGPGYWIKDLSSIEADSNYGGSVIHLGGFPLLRPRRKTKADHNRERARRRFRPQVGGSFHQEPETFGLNSCRMTKWIATAEQRELAQHIRERQAVA